MHPSPIRRTLFTAVALALTAGRLPAADPVPNPIIDLSKLVGDLNKKFDEHITAQNQINAKLVEFLNKQSTLAADVEKLRRDMETRTADKQVPPLNPLDVESLRREIESLKRVISESAKVSPTVVRSTPAATVRLVNRYVADVSVYVNGSAFVVPANGERSVAVTPGSVWYQIVGHQASPAVNTLADTQVLTVTLRPLS